MPISFDVDLVPVPSGPVPSSVVVESQPAPLLPLDLFRQILGYQPFHFWGLANENVPVDSQCNTIVAEYSYQNSNIAGRDSIRQALINAQERMRGFLEFPIAPQFIESTVDYPEYLDQRITRLTPIDSEGGWVSVFLPDGQVQAIGVESLTLLGTVAVSYSDQYSSGINDTFQVTIATTETDVSKIAVYFAAADRLNSEGAGARWRIEPVNISITGGTATITGRAWLLVKPILYQGYTRQQPLNPATSSNFVSTLEIYTRTTDPTGTTLTTAQGAFIWDSQPNFGWWGFCCANSNDPASTAQAIARVGLKDPTTGLVIPGEAVYNSTTAQWQATIPPWSGICRPPDKVMVRYLAGQTLDSNLQMNSRLARAVAYLAMAEMPDRICACDDANRTLAYYQQELNRTGNIQQETFAVTRRMLDCPLGNRRGHLYAWNEILTLRLTRGAS